MEKLKVLFVCTGNTCRSPMAEALLRHHAGEKTEARSAGIYAIEGMPATPETVTALKDRGILIDHQAKRIDRELLQWADLILTMTASHKRILVSHYPFAADKTFTLKEYAASSGDGDGKDQSPSSLDIEDPFGSDLEQYRKTAEEIENALFLWLDRLE